MKNPLTARQWKRRMDAETRQVDSWGPFVCLDTPASRSWAFVWVLPFTHGRYSFQVMLVRIER